MFFLSAHGKQPCDPAAETCGIQNNLLQVSIMRLHSQNEHRIPYAHGKHDTVPEKVVKMFVFGFWECLISFGATERKIYLFSKKPREGLLCSA